MKIIEETREAGQGGFQVEWPDGRRAPLSPASLIAQGKVFDPDNKIVADAEKAKAQRVNYLYTDEQWEQIARTVEPTPTE